MSVKKPNTAVCCPACQHVFEITLAARFWAKVDRAGLNGCWTWLGCKSKGGYGVIAVDGRNHGVHRVAFLLAGGEIPDAFHIDHLCRNTLCVNPAHLEAVSARENVRRAHSYSVTHCKHGHEYTPENTYLHPRRGTRHCRLCSTAAQRRYQARKRVAA